MNYRRNKNILLEDYQAIFYVLPKNACTSIKAQIVEELKMEKHANFPTAVHEPDLYPYPFVEASELNTSYSKYLRFCIVRNPWSRLLSCYTNKISSPEITNGKYEKGVGRIFQAYGDLFYGGMSFEAFVNTVCNIPDSVAEHHFSSQTYQLINSSGELLVNYIGRLENLEASFQDIFQKTGFKLQSTAQLNKSSQKKSYQEYYTDELIEKVRKRFAADIELLGYEFDTKPKPIGPIDKAWKTQFANSKAILPILKEKNKALQAEHKKLKKNYRVLLHSSKDTNLISLNDQLEREQRKVEAMQDSLSWKLTAPLRKLAALLGLKK